MANLTPVEQYPEVPQLETTTLVLGGPGGPSNSQAQALVDRFKYLEGENGATKVGLKVAGTGAVSRTLLSKLSDWVSNADRGGNGRVIGLGQEPLPWVSGNYAVQLGSNTHLYENGTQTVLSKNLYESSSGVFKHTTTGAGNQIKMEGGVVTLTKAASASAGATASESNVVAFGGTTWTQDLTGTMRASGKARALNFDVDGVTSPSTGYFSLNPGVAVNTSNGMGLRVWDPFQNSSNQGTGVSGLGGVALYVANTRRLLVNFIGYTKLTNDGSFVDANGTDREFTPGHVLFSDINDACFILSNKNEGGAFANNFASIVKAGYIGNHYFAMKNGSVVGQMLANGDWQNANNSYGSISDIKTKENIVDAKEKLDDLMKVRFVNFNRIGEDKKQFGVVAQELEQVFPGLIMEQEDYEEVMEDDGKGNKVPVKKPLGTVTKSVNYSTLAMLFAKGVQELTERVKVLEEAEERRKTRWRKYFDWRKMILPVS